LIWLGSAVPMALLAPAGSAPAEAQQASGGRYQTRTAVELTDRDAGNSGGAVGRGACATRRKAATPDFKTSQPRPGHKEETAMIHQLREPRRPRLTAARSTFVVTALAGLLAQAYAQQATPSGNSLETVVVTGIRSSLANSAKAKRDDVGLSETVFAEDLGKFPDPSIVDSLSRIPGVTITRASIDGEGLNVSIRGMGPAFTRVLLNGAPVASASAGSWAGSISANREVDMDFLPSELFSSASVACICARMLAACLPAVFSRSITSQLTSTGVRGLASSTNPSKSLPCHRGTSSQACGYSASQSGTRRCW
jgi:hypothetical protein